MSIQNLNGIKYTEQTLTSAQQAQARQNIGAAPLTGKYEPFYVQNNTNSALTFSIVKSNANSPTITIEKSSNGLTWESFGTTSTEDLTLNLAVGQKVYLRANATTYSSGSSSYHITKFDTANAGGKIGGNIMSLLYGSSFTGEETEFPTGSTRAFERLFYNSKLTDSSELLMPATSLVEYCYSEMFRGTSNMSKAVKCLPATNSASYCYYDMFNNSGINSIIDIKLTNVTSYSYAMFEMFKNCSSLVNPPILANSIFGIDEHTTESMFQSCTSLKTVPKTTLFIGGGGSWCGYMFYNCTSLIDASPLTMFFTASLNQNGGEYMFSGCTSLKRGVTMKCENFLNCPANTFDGMYNGCSSLKYIEARFMQRSSGEPVAVNLDSFSNGVAANGVFVKGKDVLWTTGTTGIPTDWTVIEQ